jgi:hypothetical protein
MIPDLLYRVSSAVLFYIIRTPLRIAVSMRAGGDAKGDTLDYPRKARIGRNREHSPWHGGLAD